LCISLGLEQPLQFRGRFVDRRNGHFHGDLLQSGKWAA
jgi:hypothetical protein